MSTVTRSASASPCMALNGIIDASLFPLKSTSDVVNLFRRALTSAIEPDLTLLSIVVGYIELSLTTGEAAQAAQAAQAALGAYQVLVIPKYLYSKGTLCCKIVYSICIHIFTKLVQTQVKPFKFFIYFLF